MVWSWMRSPLGWARNSGKTGMKAIGYRIVASLLAWGLFGMGSASAGIIEVIEQTVSNGYVSEDHFRQTFVPSVSGYVTEVALTAGLTYTIAPTGTPLRRSSFASDPYAGGELWFQRLDLGGLWQGWTDCIADGVCADAPHDFAFRVVIEDTPPVAEEPASWGDLKAQYR